MDKAGIFADLTRRNALRKANGLPVLDVQAEYAHQVSVDAWREYHAACDQHAAELEAIRAQVLAEYRAKYRPDFGMTMGGRWAVGHLTRQRFVAYMTEKYGISPPVAELVKNSVIYGECREDTT